MSPAPPPVCSTLLQALAAQADPAVKSWWENYLKHTVPFRGVKMGHIRSAVHHWHMTSVSSELTPNEQVQLALTCMRQPYCEDKLAGIILIHEILIPEYSLAGRPLLPAFAALFDHGHISDWNTCDWFCVKVMSAFIANERRPFARDLSEWTGADNLWRRRAAAVSFVTHAARAEECFSGCSSLMYDICAELLRSRERFAQTGAGWVIRELSKGDPDRTEKWIRAHRPAFTAEGLRYATEKYPAHIKKNLRQEHKNDPR